MLYNNRLLKTYISVISVIVGATIAGSTWSLAVVESRTGRPVMRDNPAHNDANNASIEVESYMQTPQSHVQPRNVHEHVSPLTLTQMEALQREISELRGLVEEQDHYIKQLKKSQQDLYLDLDRRLNQAHTGEQKEEQLELPKAKPASTKPKTTAQANINPILRPVNPPPPKEKPVNALRVQPGVPVPAKTDKPAPAATAAPQKPKILVDATKVPASFPNEKAHYDAAYELVRTKHYTEALTTFENYVQSYPNGENVVNAYYWIGEVYRVRWQSEKTNLPLLERAGDAFATITIQFPNHPKAADATLKLGLIEQDKGNLDVARQYFADVREHFPGTAAARLAEARLQQLN